MRPSPVHLGAGDPAGRAEVWGGDTCLETPAPPPTCTAPPPTRPRPCRPRPAPRPRGSRPARPGPGHPFPAPAPPRPRASQAGSGLTREASPPPAGNSPPSRGRRCRYSCCRSWCRCHGLRSCRCLHCSGDIVPLNRSPRRPAPPARRRDLSATAPARRHDEEVCPPLCHSGGGGSNGRAAMLGVAKQVILKGSAGPERLGRGSVTITTSSCTPLVLPILGLLVTPDEWEGSREVFLWVILRSLRTPPSQSLASSLFQSHGHWSFFIVYIGLQHLQDPRTTLCLSRMLSSPPPGLKISTSRLALVYTSQAFSHSSPFLHPFIHMLNPSTTQQPNKQITYPFMPPNTYYLSKNSLNLSTHIPCTGPLLQHPSVYLSI